MLPTHLSNPIYTPLCQQSSLQHSSKVNITILSTRLLLSFPNFLLIPFAFTQLKHLPMSYQPATDSTPCEHSHSSSMDTNSQADTGNVSIARTPRLKALRKLARSDAENKQLERVALRGMKKPRKADSHKTQRQLNNIRSAVICRDAKDFYITRLEQSIIAEEEMRRGIMKSILDMTAETIRLKQRKEELEELESRSNFFYKSSPQTETAFIQDGQSAEVSDEFFLVNEDSLSVWDEGIAPMDLETENEDVPVTPQPQDNSTDVESCVSVVGNRGGAFRTNLKARQVGSPISVVSAPKYRMNDNVTNWR